MTGTTRYCFIGAATVELIATTSDDDTVVTVNVLLPDGAAPVVEGTAVACIEEAPQPLIVETSSEPPVVESIEAPVEPSEVLAEPLGNLTSPTPKLTKKERAVPALIRGMYTALFTLLGMAGAAFTYLQDNLDKLNDISLKTIIIVVGGSLLAGFLYFIKRYMKPEGKW